MKEFGIGIIGYGFMGKAHTYAYRTMPLDYEDLPFRIRLVGICNRTLEKAQRAKEDLGFEFATDDPNELFAADNIDIINICTPNNLHKDHVIGALKAGKHVYCDKPLTATYEESEEILKVLGSTKAITQMAFQNRFFPATMRAKELIEAGFLGKSFPSGHPIYIRDPWIPKGMGWKLEKSAGGGVWQI